MTPARMAIVTLIVLSLAVGLTPAADARDIPPVCGEFYNWCENLVQQAVDNTKETLCEMEACLPA